MTEPDPYGYGSSEWATSGSAATSESGTQEEFFYAEAVAEDGWVEEQSHAHTQSTRANYSGGVATQEDGFVPLRPSASVPRKGTGTGTRRRVEAAPPIDSATHPASFSRGLIADAALSAASAKLGLSEADMATVRSVLHSEMAQRASSSMLSAAHYSQYFRVDNQYVLRKLARLVVPSGRQPWRRKRPSGVAHLPSREGKISSVDPDGGSSLAFLPPTEDVNAPDGYIPLMAMATYVAVMGLTMATRKSDAFSPAILVQSASSALGLLVFEVLLVKGAFWLVVADAPSALDCLCYAGYKLVFAALNLACFSLVHSLALYYALSACTGLIAAIFMVQTLRPFLDCPSLSATPSTVFLFLVALAQLVFIQLYGRYVA